MRPGSISRAAGFFRRAHRARLQCRVGRAAAARSAACPPEPAPAGLFPARDIRAPAAGSRVVGAQLGQAGQDLLPQRVVQVACAIAGDPCQLGQGEDRVGGLTAGCERAAEQLPCVQRSAVSLRTTVLAGP